MRALLFTRLKHPYAAVGVVLAVGMALTALVAWRLQAHARELDQARFQRLVQQHAEAIRDRVEKYELALTSLAEYAAARPALTGPEWRFRIRLLGPEQRYPGLLEIGLAQTAAQLPRAAPSDPEAHAEGRAPADTNALHLVHGWVRPPTAADGISRQFLTDPRVVAAARAALQAGAPVLLYDQVLSAEVNGNPARGLTVFVPALEAGAGGGASPGVDLSEEDLRSWRESHARGVVFGSIEPNLLLENLFGTTLREVGFDLFGDPSPALTNWLNVSGDSPLTLQPGCRPYLRTNVTLRFPAHQWAALFHTTPLFEKESPRDRPRVAAGAGAALSALVAALLFAQIRARLRQEDIAAELRATCADLQQVQNERERLGRDLHDGAIQSLYGLQWSLGHCERLLARDPAQARELLARCRLALDSLIAELRSFLVQRTPEDEPPDRVVNAGAALQQLVHRFQSASAVPIELVLKDAPPTPVTLGQQLHLRQIAQEAISNSLRHARARHLKVELRRQNRHLHLCVSDDGAGFEPGAAQAGQGLANMQARAAQLGGRLRVESRPGHGTRVTLEVPIETEAHPVPGQHPESPRAAGGRSSRGPYGTPAGGRPAPGHSGRGRGGHGRGRHYPSRAVEARCGVAGLSPARPGRARGLPPHQGRFASHARAVPFFLRLGHDDHGGPGRGRRRLSAQRK